jgi:hypothetical protein
MAESGNELRDLAQRMMKEKWDYKSQTKKYVRQVMGYYDQTDLMIKLNELNYKELKMIAGCGVPGDAWRFTLDLLKKKRDEIDLLIEEHGKKATATVELDDIKEESSNGDAGI